MKKIDIHLHPIGDKDPLMDQYVETMKAHEVMAGLVHGVRCPGLNYPNEWVQKACEKHKGKLFGSVGVDFNDGIREVISAIKDYASAGFVCIKLFPNVGYHPSDPKFDKIWDAVENLGLLCFSHCGWLGGTQNPLRNVDSLTARPFCFERAARHHPGIKFIMAHFGGGAAYLETVVLISRLSNFFADTCPGWGRWVFEQQMPGLKNLDFKKILYGTDNAGDQYGAQEKWWKETLLSMGRNEEDLKLFFNRNAASLLKLE